MNDKLLLSIIVLLLILVAWLLLRSPAPPVATPPAPAGPTAAATAGTGASARVSPTPGGFRLAGTVVGDVEYAIIEAPDGSNRLYHADDEVPGLGKLLEIRGLSAKFRGPDGEFELPLLAAPSPTAGATPAAAEYDGEPFADEEEAGEAYDDEYDDEYEPDDQGYYEDERDVFVEDYDSEVR